MKRKWRLSAIALAALGLSASLYAQVSGDSDVQALQNAKSRAAEAERRSEIMRQEAASTEGAADRILAQRAALAAEIDAANAEIAAARARIAIIAGQQRRQAAALGKASKPLLRLNALLQKMAQQPVSVMLTQPGDRRDYIHLRASMAAIEPVIARRTEALRRQIAAQRELRAQELVAIRSLDGARKQLGDRRTALAALENENREKASALSADAALEYERAIGQGERARELVEQIDTNRDTAQNAARLAELEAPVPKVRATGQNATKKAYILPATGRVLAGFGELNPTGYRERGIRLAVVPSARIIAPADGKVTFAGRYRSFGNIMIIDHGGGWTTLVTDIEELGVAAGSNVTQGMLIGRARADRPEVMIELRRYGRTIDLLALVS